MKSCTFIDDDTILCGSDRFVRFFPFVLCSKLLCGTFSRGKSRRIPKVRLFRLKERKKREIPVAKVTDAYTILKGHRSICNHIRYSPRNNLIASSGVEKIVKVWSPFEMPGSVRDPPRRESSLHGPHHFLHDYDAQDSQEEDLNTLFQFDYYVVSSLTIALGIYCALVRCEHLCP